MKMLIEHDALIKVPPDIARCPYCNGKLALTVTEWAYEDDGTVSANEIDLDCIPNDYRDHPHDYPMPYVEWLPVEEKVKAWVNQTYDFDLVDWAEKLAAWNEAVITNVLPA